MRTPLVYDGRNIYDIKEMKDAGIEYYSIGRQLNKDFFEDTINQYYYQTEQDKSVKI